jgi:hypothetical protein
MCDTGTSQTCMDILRADYMIDVRTKVNCEKRRQHLQKMCSLLKKFELENRDCVCRQLNRRM